VAADSPSEHPLEPPDRSSPRATIATFLDSVDEAWERYTAGDSSFQEPFLDARGCLDLSNIPPLVFEDVSAEIALLLKDVLDRLDLPAAEEIPDATGVAATAISRWTIPHTEIALVLQTEGANQGQWLFSSDTVMRAESFYQRVRHLPYQPGRAGGHVEELRSGSDAFLLLKLVEVMPSWFRSEVGGMRVWQWFGLGLLAVLLAAAVGLVAWIGKRWGASHFLGHQLAGFLVPLAMLNIPFAGGYMINRIFQLPGAPALVLRLMLSVVGYIGLAWLVALVLTRLGDLVLRLWFRDARPLKKQLVKVVFRIATIVVVTIVAVMALQRLGVPVAGLIAGLGVGGLAIALAAQSTLENFIGGIILYADQPVKVGDVCKFGSRRGTVEDVGLRSVKIRTLDRTVVTVPNADFARLQLENLTDRDQVLLREELCLRYETTREQLRQVLTGFETMLREHPRIAEDRLRVRFTGFGQHFLEVELFAYAMTDAWPEFLEIREDVLIKVMEIVERAGTRLALPTEVHYTSGQRSFEEAPEAEGHSS
jgi:MscS family membrane protein